MYHKKVAGGGDLPDADGFSPGEELLQVCALLKKVWEGHFQITGERYMFIFIYCTNRD